jgi:general secretion pathway protein B
MSSILKALKKLESEKAARKGEPPDIAREIARGETAPPQVARQVPYLTIALALVAGAIFAIGAALLLWPRTGTMPASLAREAMTTPPAPQPRSPRPEDQPTAGHTQFQQSRPAGQPESIPQPAATPTRRQARPAVTQLPAPAPAPAPVGIDSTAKESRTPRTTAPAPAVSQPAPQARPAEPEQKTTAPAAPDAGRPSLVVSGIAWQKDGADRLAIVNGHPVGTGATIDGAVVEEILPDRVRFSRNRQPFEVLLGRKGN